MLLPKTNIVFSSVRNNLSAIEASHMAAFKEKIGTAEVKGESDSCSSKKSSAFFSTPSRDQDSSRASFSTAATSNASIFGPQTQIGEANGWIVTVVADDFNVYVFHQFKLSNEDTRVVGGHGSSFGYNFGKVF